MTHDQIIDNLITLRAMQGISQIDLSVKAGYATNLVQRTETATSQPKLQTVLDLLNVLGYTLMIVEK